MMDINEWLANRNTPQQESQSSCPACPECPPPKLKNLRTTPEQLMYDIALDGIVVNENDAKVGPCKCVDTSDGGKLCWDKGIIGALHKDQVKKYCTDDNTEPYNISKKMGNQIDTFKLAEMQCRQGNTYKGDKINSIEDKLRCMVNEAGGEL